MNIIAVVLFAIRVKPSKNGKKSKLKIVKMTIFLFQRQNFEIGIPPLHSIVEMSEWSKKYQNFVFKSDNQRFMSRNIIVFLIQIDNNNLKIFYEGFRNLHNQFLLWNSPGPSLIIYF